jgi:caffeoyl-CoA O-methyltransferase
MDDLYSIPMTIAERRIIDRLQLADQAQRDEGLSPADRTRNISASTGAFLWQMIMGHRPSNILEIGSSTGLSTVWMASAAIRCGAYLLGTEIVPDRVSTNNTNLSEANLGGIAQVLEGDHRLLDEVHARSWDFVFLDAEKDDYLDHLKAVEPYLTLGAIILTDNVISHDCRTLQEYLRASPRYSTFTIPLDRGIEYSVYLDHD